ncbi:MAG: penicillin-binding protein 1A [Candidatus Cyclobacteriaceae bacterium M3_2C_046]
MITRLFGALLVLGLLVLMGLGIFIMMVRGGAFGSLPTYGELRNINNNIASEVYSADGELLGKYFIQERTHTDINNISPYLLKALIATEDIRFYQHHGIDFKSLGRVLFKTLLLQDESSGGGSTLTQQLVKNLYPRQDYGVLSMPVNKTREALVARRLEKIYSKPKILELYLNTVSFGENAFGIETASQRFFNKKPKALNLQEAAVLVGMLKATSTYNPRTHKDLSRQRRNLVINQMDNYNFITSREADSLKALDIELDYRNQDHNEGLATYFRQQLRQELQQALQQQPQEDGTNFNLYTDGLKIYTTLHSKMQRYAEEAMREHMSKLQQTFYRHWGSTRPWYQDENILINAIHRSPRYKKLKAQGLTEKEIQQEFRNEEMMTIFTWDGEEEKMMSPLDSVRHYLYFLNAGFLAMDPSSGDVLAWVGGIDHKYFKYDHVNINTKRQIGSTFKPIVYAAALENGMEPCEYIENERRIYEEYDGWSPQNSDGQYEGFYSMQGALTNSVNTISVNLLMETGINKAVNLAHEMGIQSNVPQVPSIALGTSSISLYEMVTAYSAFANRGRIIQPRYLVRVEDQQGNIIYQNEENNPGKKVISAETADIMIEMMKSVVNNGTGARLRYRYGLYNDIAGKTGTTQDHADGWFIGITPKLVAGAWVGADDPGIHFRSLELGQGASTALPIWGLFMKKVAKDKELNHFYKASFPSMDPQVAASLDCEPFKLYKEEGLFDLFKIFKKDPDRELEKPNPRYPKPKKNKKKKRGFFEKLKDIFK